MNRRLLIRVLDAARGAGRAVVALVTLAALLGAALVGGVATGAVPSGPDLVVSSLSKPPGVAARGAVFTVRGAVRNNGRSGAVRASVVRFYLSRDRRINRADVVIGKRRIGKLRTGKGSRPRARLTVPSAIQPGRYHLGACADASKRVRESRERNNCRLARKALRVPHAPAVRPPDNSPPGSDRDGDGSPNKRDCAPDDPSIHSDVPDKPDLGFVDRNCDGIDGDKSRAIFVAPATNGGNDASSGAFGQPKATLTNAIGVVQAATPVKDVYVAVGVYPGAVSLVDGVGIYGAYDPTSWLRTLSGRSSVQAAGTAASAHTVNVALQLMTFSGATPAAGSTYGLRAVSSTLTLKRVTLTAGSPAAGADGTVYGGRAPGGQDGQRGDPGAESGGVGCSQSNDTVGGAGGNALDPILIRRGGKGGGGGPDDFSGLGGSPGGSGGGGAGGPGTPPEKGDWNTPIAYWGFPGSSGAQGANGPAGSRAFASTGYTPSIGGFGTSGGVGRGAGGGGGGGGGTNLCNSWGGGGGGGGGGGLGGLGGGGGQPGGGAFALYLWASTVSATDSRFQAAKGGDGGAGGQGQLGGLGGKGGRRSDTHGAGNLYGGGGEQDDASNGGKGGDGGDGGTGGSGAGGAGGPSIGALIGGGSTLSSSDNSFAAAAGGAGGPSPGGNAGTAGLSRDTLTP